MTIALIPSPLVRADASWGTLPALLDAVVIDIAGDDEPPFAARFVASAVAQVPAGAVLVGHSGAGPLLPAIGAGTGARALVFLDAGIPRPGATRLDLMESEDPGFAAEFRTALAGGAVFPTWTADDLAGQAPDPVALVAGLRPRGAAFFAEPLPVPVGWETVPAACVRTSPAYDRVAADAAQRGWPVRRLEHGHFAALVAPSEVAAAIGSVVAELLA